MSFTAEVGDGLASTAAMGARDPADAPMSETAARRRPGGRAANPFRIPTSEEVASFRAREQQEKQMARELRNTQRLHEKGARQQRRRPSQTDDEAVADEVCGPMMVVVGFF